MAGRVVIALAALAGALLLAPLGVLTADRAGVARLILGVAALGLLAFVQALVIRRVLPRLGAPHAPAWAALCWPGTLAASGAGLLVVVVTATRMPLTFSLLCGALSLMCVALWLLPRRLAGMDIRIEGLGDTEGLDAPTAVTGMPGYEPVAQPLTPEPAPSPTSPATAPVAPGLIPAEDEAAPTRGVDVMLADALVAALECAQAAGEALGTQDVSAQVVARNRCAHEGHVWGMRLASVPGGDATARGYAQAAVGALAQAGATRSEREFRAALARLAEVGEHVLFDPVAVAFIAAQRTVDA